MTTKILNRLLITVFGLLGIWSNGSIAEMGCTLSLIIWVYSDEVERIELSLIKLLKGIKRRK